jgi:hypothetical protein
MGQFPGDKTGQRHGELDKFLATGAVARALSRFIINAKYLLKYLPK